MYGIGWIILKIGWQMIENKNKPIYECKKCKATSIKQCDNNKCFFCGGEMIKVIIIK